MPLSARVVRVFAAAAVLVPLSAAGLGVPAMAAPVGRSWVAARAAHRPLPSGVQQALARAKAVGRPVRVAGATTATDTLVANPNGSLTVRRSLVPVRVRAGHGWRSLDAALRRNGDGSWSPAAVPGGLRLSGGGSGRLAVLSSMGRSLAVSWPSRLPVPTISGAAATYAGVLPGVDLRVTAGKQGGFSEALVVHSAAAAADPGLQRLVLAARAAGLKLAAGRGGDIKAVTPGGVAVFAAPAPLMWDSARSADIRSVVDPVTGQRVDAHNGLPVASSAASPGVGAHVAAVGVGVRPGAIVLRPDARMLASGSTVFPVYIDPTFTAPSAGASRNAWTQVDSGFPTTSYWKESSELQVGKCYVSSPDYCNGLGVARSFLQFSVPTAIYGATILSAQLNTTEEWSPSCTAKPVEAWLTGGISSSTTWSAQPSWSSRNDTQTVANGHDSSCPAAGVGFNIASAMTTAAASHWSSVTFGLKAGDESDELGWKKFSNTATISITYDHLPNQPNGLSTSPVTSCAASPPSVVGDGNVSLYAPVSDPDGGTLGVQLQLWNTATGAAFTGTPTNPQQLYKPSGSTAVFIAHQADLEAAAQGAITEFSWKARVTDFRLDSGNYVYGPWSATCNFRFDPTRQGAPNVSVPSSASIGQPVTVQISPPSGGTLPSRYIYQLNGGIPDTETANPDGTASITVVPTRFTNTLTVTSQSPGGNIGDTANMVFNATPAATAGDSDLTGDGNADLLTAGGGGNGLPAGLWLAEGSGNGQVLAGATDIGANGNGTAGDNSPADFTGAQAMTGHFGGSGLQDVLAYYPNGGTGAVAGQANILRGNGDGSPIQAQYNDVEQTISANTFADLYNDNPSQLANGGNISGNGYFYPDLIGISGDPGNGYYLNLYPNMNGAGNYPVPYPLLDGAGGFVRTPAGGSDWNNWVIATAQLPSGTAMYVWNPAAGQLYLWVNLNAVYDPAADSYTLSYTQYAIADGATTTWNKGAALTLQAADVNGDGAPDLWAVGGGAVVTAYLATLGTTTATLTAQPAQGLTAPTHAWALNDHTSGPVTGTTTAADSAGSLPASGGGNATWNSGDLFDPDVSLDGSSGTALATTGPAIDPARDFTVSAWVKPDALGGTVLSQDMTSAASFRIYADTTSQTWKFCMATADTSTASYNCAGGGKVTVGAWVHLTGTYQASHGVMNLYLGDIQIASATHTAVTGTSGGGFQIGDYRAGGSHTGYFSGQVAGVQTFNQVTLPAQAATPDGYYRPITPARLLDTRNGTGGTTGPVAAGGTVSLKIVGAIPAIPASNVTAVAVNVTAVNESSSGAINVYPDGTPSPATSNLNYPGSTPISNLVITPVSPDGYIDLLNVSSGTTQLIADVSGYFTSDPAAPGNTTYTPMSAPKRILDTRSGLGAPKAKISGGATLGLQIGGANGIPAGVSAVAINMTAVNETASGYLIQYADGTSKPLVSGLQFQTAAIGGLAIVPVGTDGKIDSYVSSTGSTDLVADVSGYFLPGTGGEVYHPIGATRLFNTRQEGQPLAAGGTRPVSQSTVIAANPVLVLNVTAVTNSTSHGDLDVFPAGISPPGTSNVNYNAGANFANLALAATAGGVADIYNHSSSGTVDVLADCFGYFSVH